MIISARTISELYIYLKGNGGSYNDLRRFFQHCGIDPSESVITHSTTNKDVFLDKYIMPLDLKNLDDIKKLLLFIEQVMDLPNEPNPEAERLINHLQHDGWQIIGGKISPVGHSVDDLIKSMLSHKPIPTIQQEWDRARQSVMADPADALTAASAMVEATYKFILHDAGKPIPKSQKVQHLSREVHALLNISPEDTADEDFKKMFQGIISISQSISSIRTKLGDAHGASPLRGKPLVHHARLVINTAGSLCLFLLELYLDK